MASGAPETDEALSPYMRFTLRNPSERAGAVVPHRLSKQPEFSSTTVKYKRIPEPSSNVDEETVAEPSSFPPVYPRPFSMPSRASLLDSLTDDDSVLSTVMDPNLSRTSSRRSHRGAWESPIDLEKFQMLRFGNGDIESHQLYGTFRTSPVTLRRPTAVRVKEPHFLQDMERLPDHLASSCSSSGPKDREHVGDDGEGIISDSEDSDAFDYDDGGEDDLGNFCGSNRVGGFCPQTGMASVSSFGRDAFSTEIVGGDGESSVSPRTNDSRSRSWFRRSAVHTPASKTNPRYSTDSPYGFGGLRGLETSQEVGPDSPKLGRKNSTFFRKQRAGDRPGPERPTFEGNLGGAEFKTEDRTVRRMASALVRQSSLVGRAKRPRRASVDSPGYQAVPRQESPKGNGVFSKFRRALSRRNAQ